MNMLPGEFHPSVNAPQGRFLSNSHVQLLFKMNCIWISFFFNWKFTKTWRIGSILWTMQCAAYLFTVSSQVKAKRYVNSVQFVAFRKKHYFLFDEALNRKPFSWILNSIINIFSVPWKIISYGFFVLS